MAGEFCSKLLLKTHRSFVSADTVLSNFKPAYFP